MEEEPPDVLPDGVDEESFRRSYRQHLERFSEALVARLAALLARDDVSADVAEVHLEVFPDEGGDGLVSVWVYFEGRNRKVSSTDPSLFSGCSVALTEDVRLPLFDVGGYSFDTNDATVAEVIDWVAHCWVAAGGESYALPAELTGHDGYGGGETVFLNAAARQRWSTLPRRRSRSN